MTAPDALKRFAIYCQKQAELNPCGVAITWHSLAAALQIIFDEAASEPASAPEGETQRHLTHEPQI